MISTKNKRLNFKQNAKKGMEEQIIHSTKPGHKVTVIYSNGGNVQKLYMLMIKLTLYMKFLYRKLFMTSLIS